jgi:dTDP-glucose 4,6-dehydratase
MILVTGGAGFIGSNFVRSYLRKKKGGIVNLDKLTYAGSLENLKGIAEGKDYQFVQGDLLDRPLLRRLFAMHKPQAVVHFAAESHVDRSISGPDAFIQTNVVGTFSLLEETRLYWAALSEEGKKDFRFLHVSTDEVYGTLGFKDAPFTENHPYRPNSPYSASKAGADHLVRAYHHTYGLPTVISNCTNNYGPRQHPEKLIPITILNALAGKKLPLYGDGRNERNWLYVEDHCSGLELQLEKGTPGEVYLIGDVASRSNREVVESICRILDKLSPREDGVSYVSQITLVRDRPGHDLRYDVDAAKIRRELGWTPSLSFEEGLTRTVQWYLNNPEWVGKLTSGVYQEWITKQYGEEKVCVKASS